KPPAPTGGPVQRRYHLRRRPRRGVRGLPGHAPKVADAAPAVSRRRGRGPRLARVLPAGGRHLPDHPSSRDRDRGDRTTPVPAGDRPGTRPAFVPDVPLARRRRLDGVPLLRSHLARELRAMQPPWRAQLVDLPVVRRRAARRPARPPGTGPDAAAGAGGRAGPDRPATRRGGTLVRSPRPTLIPRPRRFRGPTPRLNEAVCGGLRA